MRKGILLAKKLPLIPKTPPVILLCSQLLLGVVLLVQKLHFSLVLLEYILFNFHGRDN